MLRKEFNFLIAEIDAVKKEITSNKEKFNEHLNERMVKTKD